MTQGVPGQPGWSWRRSVTAVLLLAAVAVTASVWRTDLDDQGRTFTVWPDRATTLHAADVTVAVPAGAVDRPARLTIGAPAQFTPPELVASGPAYPIRLDGAALRAPLLITLHLPDQAEPDAAFWMGHQRFDGTWVAEPATLDPDRRTLTAEVSDLSWFSVQWPDLGGIQDRLAGLFTGAMEALTNPVVFGTPGGPQEPVCAGQAAAAERGITVEVTGEPVPQCVGLAGDRARLELVNPRPYPVLVRFSEGAELLGRSGSHIGIAGVVELLEQWARETGQTGATVLRPGEQASFTVDQLAGDVVLRVEPSSQALLGAILETAVEMLATVYIGMAKAGLVRLPSWVGNDPAALATAWNLAQCGPPVAAAASRPDLLSALPQVVPDLVGCLAGVASDAMAGSVLGLLAGVVAAAVSTVVPLVRELIGSVSALSDLIRGADTTVLAVRQDPAAAVVPVASVDSPVTLFVVDVSGSMADDDGHGTVKIEGAKLAVRSVLDDDAQPPHTLYGLQTYPAAGRACSPGVPPAGFVSRDDPHLRAAVQGMTAGGNTPTGPALRAAADRLAGLNLTQPATIVLVSDGLSNCGEDPCAVANEIADQGLAIKVNTVGFRVDPAGTAELECIKDATGGSYFDVNDSDGLAESLVQAAARQLELAVSSPDEPVPAGALVTVEATVHNTSTQAVDDVRVLLSFSIAGDSVSPTVTGPLRSLGNLGPGEARGLRWQYRAPALATGTHTDFTVQATARNAAAVRVEGTVTYTGELSLALAGPILRDANRVAILGDSFSSGEGAGGYWPGTADHPKGNTCHRSDRTYAMTLDWPQPPTLLACSGAVTSNLVGEVLSVGEAESQLTQLRKLSPPPDLVLLTIGGNDIGFTGIVTTCVVQPSCVNHTVYPNPELTGECLRRYARELAIVDPATQVIDGCAPRAIGYPASVFAEIEGIRGTLRSTYESIDAAVNSRTALADRAGRPAHIVVLPYPLIVPPVAQHGGSCGLGLGPDAVGFGAELIDRLNQTITEAAQELRDEGRPIYVATDVADAFLPNHTVCDRDPHVAQVTAGGVLDTVRAAGAGWLPDGPARLTHPDSLEYREIMHPTAAGYLDMTAALLRWSYRPEAAPLASVDPSPWAWENNRLPLADGTVLLGPSLGSALGTWPSGVALQLQGGGFAPGTTVQIDIYSVPYGVGVASVAADGTIDTRIPLARNLRPGLHTVVASGLDPYGEPVRRYSTIDVRRPHPPWRTVLWGAATALLLAAAAGWYLQARSSRPDPAW